jgi:predicted metalloprotease
MGGGTGGRGMAVGGGVGGLIILLIAVFTGMDPSALLPTDGGGGADQPAGGALEQCETGADIETNPECRFVAVQNSVEDFWEYEFAEAGGQYESATFTTFTGGVNTGCGSASSQVGPFYCPPDKGVYLDLGFFETMKTQLGAQGGDFAEAYVVAHEYGHHVQNLTGQMDRVRTQQGADSDAVALELQADCYAGVWAHGATNGVDGGEPIITEITDADIAEAIDASESVGDDYIQERMQGTVTPETWTHGSSEQRREWFLRGMKSGDAGDCDTFSR